ncbi:hypothetical protein K443DRAFT_686307 [Laccaria amethystina LaAM-08-1]|uniref:Uncharacterized protein n=1 Tax=Laccaria amethystina LaAM-08-1 TaxID=1095629 RepID=A0A0C9WSN1_9AGAR|nr:hypothetical protein K443DRAFT_686307 [Laccaria amethystina LaAM-08-1]
MINGGIYATEFLPVEVLNGQNKLFCRRVSSRERVTRREAAAIADDKNMRMQVQNGVENHPDLKRAMLSRKRKSQRTSFKKYKCNSKHSPIHGSSIVCVLESLGVDGHEKRRRKTT